MGWRELEALLPLIFIISIVVILLVTRVLDYLKHRHMIRVIVKLLESDSNIDVELLKSIAQKPVSPLADLRRGLVLIAICFACVIFAQNMMDPEYKRALRGLSAFPGLIGVIYLLFHRLPLKNTGNKLD